MPRFEEASHPGGRGGCAGPGFGGPRRDGGEGGGGGGLGIGDGRLGLGGRGGSGRGDGGGGLGTNTLYMASIRASKKSKRLLMASI